MKSNLERKKEERSRKRKAGFVPVEVWIKKEKKQELKIMVERLNNG